MTNSHGYILEYPRIRVDRFDQANIPLPPSLHAHGRSIVTEDSEQDAFAAAFAPGQTHFDKPLLYLLTHIHTDHLKGLDRPGITAPIYCSYATKNLLLRYERQKSRIERDKAGQHEAKPRVVRPYAHLFISDEHATAKSRLSGYQADALELLRPLPYNTPTRVPYTPTTSVTLTLIESNHMCGGAMFLVEGDNGAALHTGDFRAEEWWCDAVLRNPLLSKYTAWQWKGRVKSCYDAELENHDRSTTHSSGPEEWAHHNESLGRKSSTAELGDEGGSACQNTDPDSQTLNPTCYQPRQRMPLRLENIYLDTELLMCNEKVPSKQQACLDMIDLMRLYPADTVFFLNSWTWGYEHMLIATAKAFGSKIHVDRFKAIMFRAARNEWPFLSEIVTPEPTKTRFHACERNNMCAHLRHLASRCDPQDSRNQGLLQQVVSSHSQTDSDSPDERSRWGKPQNQPSPLLVYVNPGQVSADQWPKMFSDTKLRLRTALRGETSWPEALIVPLERHSTLPEIQHFVGLFRPKTVSPNTILDPKGGLDYYLLHHLFGHLLASPAAGRRLAREGLALLGDQTWSFYQNQIALARQQAQRCAGDSTEVQPRQSGSQSDFGPARNNSLDAVELDHLSRLRGISVKGIMMQNMAGNLAAMLEIERWRKASGTEEPASQYQEETDQFFSHISGDHSQANVAKAGMGASSVDYDADHHQEPDCHYPGPLRATVPAEAYLNSRIRQREPSKSIGDFLEPRKRSCPLPRERDADRGIGSQPSPRFDQQTLTHLSLTAANKSQSIMHSRGHAASLEKDISTLLTEDLANRYLNVLIHHFKVPFNRSASQSYTEMWGKVRKILPTEARKTEEHWFRETGIMPPHWPEPQIFVDANETTKGGSSNHGECCEPRSDVASLAGPPRGNIVESLNQSFMAPSLDEAAMLWHADALLSDVLLYEQQQQKPHANNGRARTIILTDILKRVIELGFSPIIAGTGTPSESIDNVSSNVTTDDGGRSQSFCRTESNLFRWKPFAPAVEKLCHLLVDALDLQPNTGTISAIHLASLLLGYRVLSELVQVDNIRSLVSRLIDLVNRGLDHTTPLQIGSVSELEMSAPAIARITRSAWLALTKEKVNAEVLVPLEDRLIEAANRIAEAARNGDACADLEIQIPVSPNVINIHDVQADCSGTQPGSEPERIGAVDHPSGVVVSILERQGPSSSVASVNPVGTERGLVVATICTAQPAIDLTSLLEVVASSCPQEDPTLHSLQSSCPLQDPLDVLSDSQSESQSQGCVHRVRTVPSDDIVEVRPEPEGLENLHTTTSASKGTDSANLNNDEQQPSQQFYDQLLVSQLESNDVDDITSSQTQDEESTQEEKRLPSPNPQLGSISSRHSAYRRKYFAPACSDSSRHR